MDALQIVLFIYALLIVSLGIISALLIKRSKPDRRGLWFLLHLLIMTLTVGLKFVVLPAGLSLFVLRVSQKEDDEPVKDIGIGVFSLCFKLISFTIYLLLTLIPIGGLYWMYLALKLGSFAMFVIGVIPFTWLLGAYSLLFGVPDWVLKTFG